jgi:hypothetical protein
MKFLGICSISIIAKFKTKGQEMNFGKNSYEEKLIKMSAYINDPSLNLDFCLDIT